MVRRLSHTDHTKEAEGRDKEGGREVGGREGGGGGGEGKGEGPDSVAEQ